MQRIVIVGLTGSGKTTLGAQVAALLGIPAVDLDVLHWQPNWQECPTPEFREKVRAAVAGDSWVVSGNYSKTRDILLERADTLVWLDYPFWFAFRRLFSRTLRRIITREELWAGNRERFWTQFLSKESIFYWAWQSYAKHQALYPTLTQQPTYQHIQFIRLHSQAETDQWLSGLQAEKKVI